MVENLNTKPELFRKLSANFSLIPLNGKNPDINGKNWQRFCYEKRPYLESDFVGRNAGVCCGPASGVIIPDIDDPTCFDAVCKENCLSLPKTLKVKTGGGYHLYYRYPSDGYEYGGKSLKHPIFRKSTVFDVKGAGGQVVAPGSIHPDTGKHYTIIEDEPIAEAPEWVLNYITGKLILKTESLKSIPPSKILNDHIESLPLSGSTKRLILQGAPLGERSEAGMKVLKALVGAGIHDNIIFWLFDYYPVGEKYREKGNSKHKWLTDEIQRARKHNLITPTKTPIRGLNIADFLTLELPERQYIIEPLLPQQGLVSIYGPRGMGKTYLLLTLGAAVSTGKDVLRWRAPLARKVLYIDGEMPARTMQERIAHILPNFGDDIDPENFHIITPDLNPEKTLNLSRVEDQEVIDGYVSDAELIIIDSLSTLARHGEENRAESWLPVQEYLLKLRKRGKSVIIAHHAGKNGQQRGTSAKEDILDTVIALRRPKDYQEEQGARFEVVFEKARGICGDAVKSFEAKLEQDRNRLFWSCRDIEDIRIDQARELKNEGLTVREIAEELGISKSAAGRLLKKV